MVGAVDVLVIAMDVQALVMDVLALARAVVKAVVPVAQDVQVGVLVTDAVHIALEIVASV